jgi:hypothetical protein
MDPKNTFVAFFDFLGFKAWRAKQSTQALYALYKDILLPTIKLSAALDSREGVDGHGQPVFVPVVDELSLRVMTASDSVLLVSNGDSFGHFMRIVTASHSLLGYGFAGHGAPLRGAIGHGDLIFDDDSICVGSALEDSYAHESRQVWAGCSFSENSQAFCEASGYFARLQAVRDIPDDGKVPEHDRMVNTIAAFVVDYDIPLYENPKDGAARYYSRPGKAVNWTDLISSKKKLLPPSDEHSKRIAQNTFDFERWVRERSRGQTPGSAV